MRRIITLSLVCTFFVLNACSKENTQGNRDDKDPKKKIFMAGASVSTITGTPPSNYVIHDELNARTLVLDDGTTRLVFVVVDEQVVPREVFDEAKRLILVENKIDPKNVMMSTTHTHSAGGSRAAGPTKYSWNYGKKLDAHQTYVARQIANGVREAVINLEPAKIGWGVGEVPQWTFNRRWLVEEPIVNPYGGFDKVASPMAAPNAKRVEPAGPTDPEVSFISVQALDGRPISIFANYSTHYAGGIPENHVSADYFAVFSDSMEEMLGASNQSRPFVGIMSNGTSGDLNTVDRIGNQPTFAPYGKIKAVADDVAEEVFRVYKNIDHQTWVPLQTIQTELSLKIRRADKQLLDHVNAILSQPTDAPLRHPRERIQANYVMQLEKEWPDNIPVILQTIKIGDLAISAVPFEVFAEMGLELKQKSPFKTTFTVELANGWYGYLPTPEQHELGGWETWMGGSNKVQEDASELITERLLEMMSTLQKK